LGYYLGMPVVVREAGFSVRVLTTGEHAPPHVHVFKAGAECRVLIGDAAVLWDIKGGPFAGAEVRRAVALVDANLPACNAIWRACHGDA